MPPQGTKARERKPGRKPKSEESATKKQTGGRKQQMPKNASSRGRGGKTQGTRQSGKKAGGKGQKRQTKNGASSSKRGGLESKKELTVTERLDLLIMDSKITPVMDDFNRELRRDLEARLRGLGERIRKKPARCKKATQRGTTCVKSGMIWRTSYLRKLPKPTCDKPMFASKFWGFITREGLFPGGNCTVKNHYRFSTRTLLRSIKKNAPKINKEKFPTIVREKPNFDASFWGYVTDSGLLPVYGSAVNKKFLDALRDSFYNMRNAAALEVIRQEGEKIVYGKNNEKADSNLIQVPRKSHKIDSKVTKLTDYDDYSRWVKSLQPLLESLD